MPAAELWEYPHNQADWATGRLVGYNVEALDGGIGTIDRSTIEAGAHSVVVDTGTWIFERKVMLPAGLIEKVEHTTRTAYVSCTKDQVKDGPEFTDNVGEDASDDPSFRERMGAYWNGLRS